MPESRQERPVTIRNPRGLHMRFAAAFAEAARKLAPAKVSVRRDESRADGASWLELMLLAAEPGVEVWLEVEGEGADRAAEELAAILSASSVDQWEDDPDA